MATRGIRSPVSSFSFTSFPVPVLDRRSRAILGLVFLVVAYVGGIIGWTWAAASVDGAASSSESSQTRVETVPEIPVAHEGEAGTECRIVLNKFVA